MGEITEVFEDIKDTVGNKGFLLLGAGVGLLFIINLMKNNEPANTTVSMVGYSAYPEVDKNADVIISTLQDSISYSENIITENQKENMQIVNDNLSDMMSDISDELGEMGTRIEDSSDELKFHFSNKFEATNDYINSGLSSQKKLLDEYHNEIIGSLTNVSQSENVPNSKDKPVSKRIIPYVTKKGLNTNTSIVDALKASGEDSSFSARAKLYSINGGKGEYTGSYSQNVSMLNKLKSGSLHK